MNRRTLIALAALLPAFLMSAPAFAGKAEVFTGLVEGVGAGGYDSVSYFTGTPVEGSKEFSTKWKGAEWRFASAANRDAFVAARKNMRRNMAATAPSPCPKARSPRASRRLGR